MRHRDRRTRGPRSADRPLRADVAIAGCPCRRRVHGISTPTSRLRDATVGMTCAGGSALMGATRPIPGQPAGDRRASRRRAAAAIVVKWTTRVQERRFGRCVAAEDCVSWTSPSGPRSIRPPSRASSGAISRRCPSPRSGACSPSLTPGSTWRSDGEAASSTASSTRSTRRSALRWPAGCRAAGGRCIRRSRSRSSGNAGRSISSPGSVAPVRCSSSRSRPSSSRSRRPSAASMRSDGWLRASHGTGWGSPPLSSASHSSFPSDRPSGTPCADTRPSWGRRFPATPPTCAGGLAIPEAISPRSGSFRPRARGLVSRGPWLRAGSG